ncbi:hypothetical protein O3P69_000297 [Scylla paramamosain]|uniref:Uncharacterized protein n=1 Tax=Scylla paramamosain TaxID=85552 RepID=A0AAW0UYQ5_SCYPA
MKPRLRESSTSKGRKKSFLLNTFPRERVLKRHYNSLVVTVYLLSSPRIVLRLSAATIMPASLSTAAAASHHMERSLRTLGFDLTNMLKTLDLQTVGLLGLLILAGILLFDLFAKGSNYGHASYPGSLGSGTYASYGRKGLLDSSASGTSHLEPSARTSRSLESVTQILESLAEAAMKYRGRDADEEQIEPKEQHLN